ncbi:MFS transporter [Jatrophihabitans sp. YIM 134969]
MSAAPPANLTKGGGGEVRKSLVPVRMDRLPWARFHWLVVFGLGTAWILDGLEIQLAALNGFNNSFDLSAARTGSLGTIYLVGEIVGALFFGRITDKFGRKKMFVITLAIYLVGSGLAGFSWDYWSLAVFRFIAGIGIGGEYAAINAAIDELIPSHYRGRVDIAVNGTYWGGALLGTLLGYVLIDHEWLVPADWGWRIAFWLGPLMGFIIIFLRRHLPESPRWLMTHGRDDEAEEIVSQIEHWVEEQDHVELTKVDESKALPIVPTPHIGYVELLKVFITQLPSRTVLGATMMITQSFLYNAIFFSYEQVLTNFYGVKETSLYFVPFALGNLLGPLLLGHLFDTWGRRKMILLTYGLAGLMLIISAFLFRAEALNAATNTLLWCVIFFFASAGASSAYLTVSEIFPIEVRGLAIAVFFSIGQGAGSLAPTIYGALIGEGKDRTPLMWGYIIGGAIMIIGGLVAWFIGVDSERKALEDVATPLSVLRARAAGADIPTVSRDAPSPAT